MNDLLTQTPTGSGDRQARIRELYGELHSESRDRPFQDVKADILKAAGIRCTAGWRAVGKLEDMLKRARALEANES